MAGVEGCCLNFSIYPSQARLIDPKKSLSSIGKSSDLICSASFRADKVAKLEAARIEFINFIILFVKIFT